MLEKQLMANSINGMESFISFELVVYILISLFVFAYWAFAFVILYHLTRFGIGTKPKIAAVIFLFGSIWLFFMSVVLSSGVDIESLKIMLEQFYFLSSPTI